MRIGLFALVLAGCGGEGSDDPADDDGPDLAGLYEVTRHTLARTLTVHDPVDCTTEGDAADEPPYIRLVEGFIDGFDLEECNGTAESDCTFTLWSFDTPGKSGWSWNNSSTQTGSGDCGLYHQEAEVTDDGGGSVTIVLKDWTAFEDLPDSECTLDAAAALGDERDCMHHEVIEATLVQ